LDLAEQSNTTVSFKLANRSPIKTHLATKTNPPLRSPVKSYITELDQTELSKLVYSVVSRLQVDEQLHELHRLTAEKISHFDLP
jgi:hypothetical protein